MNNTLKIAFWNANGLTQRRLELTIFLIEHSIDIMLISETHFTEKNYLKIPNCIVYDTKHPDGKVHGGTALIIDKNIKHFENNKYHDDYLQATTVTIVRI